MKAENIADVLTIGGHVIWRPKEKFIALGFAETDCGPHGDGYPDNTLDGLAQRYLPDSIRQQIFALNRAARMAKKADKEQRKLARWAPKSRRAIPPHGLM